MLYEAQELVLPYFVLWMSVGGETKTFRGDLRCQEGFLAVVVPCFSCSDP
jgi:hypothetical protein